MEVKIHDKSIGLDVFGDGEVVEDSGEASERIEVQQGRSFSIEVKQAMSGKSPSQVRNDEEAIPKRAWARKSTSELQPRWQLDANSYETGLSGSDCHHRCITR